MFTNKRSSIRVRAGAGLLVLVSVLVVALGTVSPASAAPRVGSVTVGAQTGTLTTGTGGTATYLVTVAKGSTFSLTADLTVSGLPIGATGSFAPAQLVWGSFLPTGTTRTSTLTITTTAGTPAGATPPFTVKATRSTDTADYASAPGTLTVLAGGGNSQTITFAPLADKSVGDPDFSVSATASSGLTVGFAASGQCTVAGALVHLTGAGSCTITASQAGSGNFTAAPLVARTFSILATGSGIDLYAVAGTTTLPGGASVPVWGYNTTNAAVTRPGGPTLTVDQGDTVAIRLHNQLGERTALLIQGQTMIPDTTGVASEGTKLYTFTASRPGTYLYEAGLVPNAQHQAAMGLYGALIVRPTTAPATTAYGDAATAFNNEAVLVLSEIDPALNNSADPATFDMRKYAPRYFLINGKAYPATDPIATAAGNKVLLRYVNAGIQYHSMALLGAHQTVIALDGSKLDYSRRYVAETFGPGQTADAIVTVPAATVDGSKLAVYDGSLLLHNSNEGGFGGMLTFLEVAAGSGGPDATGPSTSAVAYAAGTLTATVSDTGTGGTDIEAAEYFVDTVAAPGMGTSMTATTPPFDSPTEGVTAAVPPLSGGPHTLYVRGKDALGNWGAVSSVLVSGGDTAGPITKSATLTPSLTTGTVPVAVHATGDDTTTGGSNIAAAEFTIDGSCPQVPDCSMTVNLPAPIASLDATISAATVLALSVGPHDVAIRSRDAAGNWGAPKSLTLTRAAPTGPVASGVSAAPSPNNGTIPFNASIPAVRVKASFAGGLNVSAAEAFIDTVGANGTGIPMRAVDGTFNSPAEDGYADIPLATVAQLSNGNHTISVHGKDGGGTWGSTSSTILVIDKIAPTVVSINRIDPDPTTAATVRFLVTFSESVNGVTPATFGLTGCSCLTGAAITSVTDVTGTGVTRTVTATTGSGGGGTLGLNLTSAAGITDLATNALPPTGLPVVGQVYTQPSPPLYFSTAGNTNPTGLAGTADDADIYNWNGTAFSRAIDVTAITNPLPTGANVDGFDRIDATHFYLSFNGSVTIAIPGPDLSVADEDVVYYNAGTWTLFFDGSVNGVGGTDLDAISIVAGTLYFSTDDTDVPPGAGGTGDDADIYRWNGGNSYTRMIDASALGWSTTNVDGLVWVDATHLYLSYSADTTAPGIGAVQDEDVVRNNGGSWSVYFNGTARGLDTSGNLDVDAFDLP